VTQELLRHSAAEKQWLYPELRKLADRGNALADDELREHAAVEKVLKKLENQEDPDAPMYHSYLTALIADVRRHIAEEENDVFPRLRAAIPPADLHRLGAEVEKAERNAPTHPHPAAPAKQPGNKILTPIISMMDRIRDQRHHGRHSNKR
jgi:hemerythrin superfamily protein